MIEKKRLGELNTTKFVVSMYKCVQQEQRVDFTEENRNSLCLIKMQSHHSYLTKLIECVKRWFDVCRSSQEMNFKLKNKRFRL